MAQGLEDVCGASTCRVCGKAPVLISLRGDVVASSYGDFKRAVGLAFEMAPCRRLTFDLHSVHCLEALAGMFVMEIITPHRELRLVLANIPAGLGESLQTLQKALGGWIDLCSKPISLGPANRVYRHVASFAGRREHCAWRYGVYSADLH